MTTTEPVRFETSPKRVRAFIGGQAVFDTVDARLVWEVSYYPQYYVPRDSVEAELVPTGRTKTSQTRGTGHLWTVRAGGREAIEAATTYDESPVPELRDLVRFKWDEMDAWFEEDEQVYTHPRSPYRRVDILPTSRPVVVRAHSQTVVDSERAYVLFETGLPPRFYLPKTDARMDLLEATDRITHCPHKGQAEYWTLRAGGEVFDNAVWSYRHPLPECTRIAGLVCYDTAQVDVVVDGVPQR